jgi:hypothetical protein
MESVTKLGSDWSRPHHYQFGHRALRDISGRHAANMPAMIEAGQMDEALARTWQEVGQQLPVADRLEGAGLTASLYPVAFGEIVLITLPEAEHTNEAHFVAITLIEGRTPRYFTLEHSWTWENEPSTVLGEWNEQGHLNYGEGPHPEPAAFLMAVQAHLA